MYILYVPMYIQIYIHIYKYIYAGCTAISAAIYIYTYPLHTPKHIQIYIYTYTHIYTGCTAISAAILLPVVLILGGSASSGGGSGGRGGAGGAVGGGGSWVGLVFAGSPVFALATLGAATLVHRILQIACVLELGALTSATAEEFSWARGVCCMCVCALSVCLFKRGLNGGDKQKQKKVRFEAYLSYVSFNFFLVQSYPWQW